MLIPDPETILKKLALNMNKDSLNSSTLDLIAKEYNFNVQKHQQISKRDHVHDTSSFLIQSNKGRSVLREHIKNVSIDSLLYEHSLLNYLYQKNLKVARPLTNLSNQTFIKMDDKFYVLFDFIPGYLFYDYLFSRSDKKKHHQQAAEALAQFHYFVKDFQPSGQKSRQDFKQSARKLDAYHHMVMNKDLKGYFDYYFINNNLFLRDKLLELGEAFDDNEQLPRCIIHGDFGQYNLIFRDQQLVGILDFIDAHLDYKAKDVIYSLFVFTKTRKSFYEQELLEVFLDGYQKVTPVYEDEIELMPDLFCFKRLNELPFYLDAHYSGKGNSLKYQLFFTRFVTEIQWHQKYKLQLIKQIKKQVKRYSHIAAKTDQDKNEARKRPLKILSVTTVFPFPPDNGTKITIYHRLRWLAEKNKVTMLCIHSDDIKQEYVDEMEKYCRVKLIHDFRGKNIKGIFQPAIKYFKSLWSKVPYFLEENISQEAESWLNGQIRRGAFDLVEAENDCATMYLKPNWNIFKVAILHSVNDAAMRRQIKYEKKLLKKIKAIAYRIVWRNYEKQLDRSIDLCATLTKQNEQEILRLNPNIPAKNCLTNGVDLNYFQFQFSNKRPNGICFVGLMNYPPNVDAVVYCYQKIFPLIRKVHNDVKFYIVGSSPPTKVMQLAQDKMVEVTGYVEDIRPYLRKAGIAIVPTRMGGGILNKILEPLAMGIPVVTRSRSLEGLNVKNGEELLIADHAVNFANAVIRLLNDESLRYKLTHNGRKYVENHHQWKKIIDDYEAELRNQLTSLQAGCS